MKFESLRQFALSLPEVTEEPHHHFGSFRVSGKIFVTVPPGDEFLHVFVSEQDREQALELYPEFVEKLFWGGKVMGLRLSLGNARASAVKHLVQQAWRHKAPKSLESLHP